MPENKWSIVVTLYGEDAARLSDFLGDPGGYSSCVVILDREGVVAWLHSTGYSDEKAQELSGILGRLA